MKAEEEEEPRYSTIDPAAIPSAIAVIRAMGDLESILPLLLVSMSANQRKQLRQAAKAAGRTLKLAEVATFGTLVDPKDVPALVRAGRDVWSFGYGADLDLDDTLPLADRTKGLYTD